jgi:O-antigen ligase
VYLNRKFIKGFLWISLIVFSAQLIINIPSPLKFRYDQSKKIIMDYKFDDGRKVIWNNGLKMVKENLLFGTGAGDIKMEFEKSVNNDESLNEQEKNLYINKKYNLHNQYLQTFATIGVIGLFLLLYVIIHPGVFYLSNKNYLQVVFLVIISVSFFSFFYSMLIILPMNDNKSFLDAY